MVKGSAGQSYLELYYLKSKRGRKTPDFYVRKPEEDSCIIEIKGKKKGFLQFKGIKAERKIIATYPFISKPNAIPLYEFGFLY